ncbi:hypothetical protein AVEN_12692-1 [Araneus ventricosus]|uniref:Uncharacterized protein n=1 Tax=Araneus ventricosus TaxID=182803 RepID=A0A4Y2AAY3_ARAVE|nr:hypothetical protein AVEN_12692-1 [Araneus ventricosus]
MECEGSGGLVVTYRLWGRRVPGSIPDSNENPPCMWVWCTLNLTSWAKSPPAAVVRRFGEGCQLRCRPLDLTKVQNYEVRPKIALVLLQNGTLI